VPLLLSSAIQPVSVDWTLAHPEVLRADVRPPPERARGTLPRAYPLPLDGLERARELGVWARLLLVSEHGVRAELAAARLADLGMRRVYLLDGGLRAWLDARLPLEPGHDLPALPIFGALG
jgi:rhodanese-related sulfurtransferase